MEANKIQSKEINILNCSMNTNLTGTSIKMPTLICLPVEFGNWIWSALDANCDFKKICHQLICIKRTVKFVNLAL